MLRVSTLRSVRLPGEDIVTFAMFYNQQDINTLATSMSSTRIKGADRTYVNQLLADGLANWQNLPLASSNPVVAANFNLYCMGDTDCRMIIITVGTKAQLVSFCAKFWDEQDGVLGALGNDIATRAVEPWPPA